MDKDTLSLHLRHRTSIDKHSTFFAIVFSKLAKIDFSAFHNFRLYSLFLAKCFFQKIQEHLRAFQEGTIGPMD